MWCGSVDPGLGNIEPVPPAKSELLPEIRSGIGPVATAVRLFVWTDANRGCATFKTMTKLISFYF